MCRGAGTNLKVGGGGTNPAQSDGKKFCHAPPPFGFKRTVSRLGERFRGVQYSLVSLLFAVLILTVLPCPAIPFVKVRGHVPLCPMESAPLYMCVRDSVSIQINLHQKQKLTS